jgi:chromosome segregation ATPase
MTEQEAYVKKMEAEKQQLDARLAEVEAEADIRQTDAEIKELSGAKRRAENYRRKLEEIQKRGTENFENIKAELRGAYEDLHEAVIKMETKVEVVRAGYERKREAELRNLGAQFDGWEASMVRTRAEDSLLTREELNFLRRSLQNTQAVLKDLMTSKGKDWPRMKKEYEAAWNDLLERSEKIRADTVKAEQPAGEQPSTQT